MKNREYKKLVAIAMTAALLAGSFGAVPSMAADTKVQSVQTEAQRALKDETVYAKIDGNGAVKSVIVSDQLKNVKGTKDIKDTSALQAIENVKGEEAFTQNGTDMHWKGDGENICYQGTTTKSLPVNVKITYELNGQEIKAEELEGKSGHLVMRYQYENTTKDSGEVYTPFLMATGVVLDDAKFNNITVKNAKVLSDGDRNMVLGMGIPNMKEALGVEELDIPDSFEIEADVTEYEAVQGITVATNDIFNEIKTDKFEDLSDLKNAMNDLQSASQKLINGSGELKDGLGTLLASSGTLVDGVNQLAGGGKELKAGTDGLKKGAADLNGGLKVAADKTQNMLLPGIRQLDAGVDQMQQELSEGIKMLGAGAASLNTNLGTLQGGTAALNAIINTGTEQTGGVSLQAMAAKAAEDAKTLAGGAASGSVTMRASDVVSGNGGTAEAIAMLKELAANNPELQETVNQAIAKLNADQQAREAEAAKMDAQINASTGNVNASIAGQLAQEAGTVSAVVNSLAGEEGVAAKVDAGLGQAKAGADKLDAAVNDQQQGLGAKAAAGLGSLKQGTKALRDGVDGENGLASGLGQLSAGASQVAGGAGQLHDGASALYSGLYTLQTNSGALVDGVKQLDDGADELHNGMMQFDEEGIQKLVNVFDGDMEGLLDKLNEMLDASKAYNNFSGISDEMDGQVKFIFVTE